VTRAAALQRGRLWATRAVLAGLALSLSAWTLHYRAPASDEGAILTQAAKILRGGLYYQDIDAYPFPLASYLLAGWMALFGESVQSARMLAALVFTAIVLTVHGIALRVVSPGRALRVALALLSLKFIAWPGLSAYFYWDVAFALACVAIALYLGDAPAPRGARLFAVGVFTGLALLTKQTVGITLGAALIVLLLWPALAFGPHAGGASDPATRRHRCAVLCAGAAAALLPALAWFAAHGVLGAMLWSGFVRPFTGYLPTSGLAYDVPLRWWEFGRLRDAAALPYLPEPLWQMLRRGEIPGRDLAPVHAALAEVFARAFYSVIPAVLIAMLWLRRRERSWQPTSARSYALALLAAALLLSAFPRADFPHLISLFPLVAVLIFHLSERLPWPAWQRAGAQVETGAVALLLATTGALGVLHTRNLTHHMQLERADLWVSPENAFVESVVRYVRDEVAPDEGLFVWVHEAQYYFLADRYFGWPFVQLYPGMTGDREGRALAQQLVAAPPRLVVRGLLGIEGIPDPDDYAPNLARAVESLYRSEPRVFERYPPAGPVPPEWLVKVMRARRAPGLHSGRSTTKSPTTRKGR